MKPGSDAPWSGRLLGFTGQTCDSAPGSDSRYVRRRISFGCTAPTTLNEALGSRMTFDRYLAATNQGAELSPAGRPTHLANIDGYDPFRVRAEPIEQDLVRRAPSTDEARGVFSF